MKSALATFVLALALSGASALAQQKNIFDDDWDPPAPPSKEPDRPAARPRPVAPPRAPVDRPPPTPPARPPVVAPGDPPPTVVAPPEPAKRRPVPSPVEQASVRRLMKEVYGPQLADRTPAGRRKLSETLLAQAEKSAVVPAEHFVLLAAAVDASVQAADLPSAFRAADSMATTFEVDGLAMKANAAAVPLPQVNSREAADANVRAALALADELADADDYAAAIKVCAAAQPTAVSADASVRNELSVRQRALVAQREAAARVAKEFDKLKAEPDDPAANLAVGRYLCFVKDDWDDGLAHLAKCDDPTLKALATLERAGVDDAADLSKLADGWMDAAPRQPDAAARAAVAAHAADLFQRELATATGLRKQVIERRLAEAERLAAADAGRGVRSFVVEALIDGSSTLHVTPGGIYWKSHGVSKAGRHGGRNEPTYVDGAAWRPQWQNPAERGHDRSDPFPLRVGTVANLQVELIGCSDRRGEQRVNKRDPIRAQVVDNEFVVTIPDNQGGSQWYRLRISRKF